MQKAHVEIPTTRQLHQQYNRAMSRDSDHHDGPRTHEPTPNKQSLPLIFTVMALILCLLAFFIVYFCRYVTTFAWFHRNPAAGTTIQIHRSESSPKGLDPLIISSFPIFTYASVKDHRQEKCELECAVCLSEFSGDDVLRLLSVCNHAFHPECIDLWFQSHTTCPVCRGDLDLQFDKSIEKAPEVVVQVAESETEEEEEDSGARVSFREEQDRGSEHRVTVDWLARPVRPHSTGHSPAVDDRFTLRLPENIKEEIVRERKRTGSCITFRDVSNSVDTGKYELEGPENPEFRHPSDQI